MSNKNTRTTAMSGAALSGLLRKQGVNPKSAGNVLGYDPAVWSRRLKNGVVDQNEADQLRTKIRELEADTPVEAEPAIQTVSEAVSEVETEATPTTGKVSGRSGRKGRQPTEKAEKAVKAPPPANRPTSTTWRRSGGLDHTQLERSMSLAGYTLSQGLEYLRSTGDSVNKKLVALRFSTPDMAGEDGTVHGWALSQVRKYGTFGGPERSRALDWKDVPAELRAAVKAVVGKPKGEPLTRPVEAVAA